MSLLDETMVGETVEMFENAVHHLGLRILIDTSRVRIQALLPSHSIHLPTLRVSLSKSVSLTLVNGGVQTRRLRRNGSVQERVNEGKSDLVIIKKTVKRKR